MFIRARGTPGSEKGMMERMCALEKNKIQKLLWIGVSILLCCLAAWWDGGREEAEQQARQSAAQGAVSPVQTIEVTVCISGAVAKPGLYRVPKGSRAQEAILLAGGITEEADMDRVNLAKVCKEGTHIKIPRMSQARWKRLQAEKPRGKTVRQGVFPAEDAGKVRETVSGQSDPLADREQMEAQGKMHKKGRLLPQEENGRGFRGDEGERAALINLNAASEAELTLLPGVGPATAKRIVAYRTRYGFRCIEDLLKVAGIGPAKLEKLRHQVTI